MEVIIRGKAKFGKTRSEQEMNLRKEWGQTVTDEQLDKIKHLEKRTKEQTGSDGNFIGPIEADELK